MSFSRPTLNNRLFFYLLPPMAVLGLFFFLPLATMMRYSLLTTVREGVVPELTVEHYARFFTDSFYVWSLLLTLATGFLVVGITIVVSYPVAYLYWRSSGRTKSALLVLLLSPFYVNIVVKVFGWMVLLARFGLVNRLLVWLGALTHPFDFLEGYWGILIVLVHRSLPFMVLLVAASLEKIDETVLESARICGSGGPHLLRKVILPLSAPGVLAGSVLVFSLTVAAFVVPLLVGGTIGERFASVLMYQNISVTQNWHFGAAIGVILLATSILAISLGTKVIKSIRFGRVVSEGFVR